MGATFGGGGNTLFGAGGADNLLTRVTTVTAFIFMCTSVYLSMAARPMSSGRSGNLFQGLPENSSTEIPAPINLPAAPPTGAPVDAGEAGNAATGAAVGKTTETSNTAPESEAAKPVVPEAVPPAPPSAPVDSAPPAQPGAAAH